MNRTLPRGFDLLSKIKHVYFITRMFICNGTYKFGKTYKLPLFYFRLKINKKLFLLTIPSVLELYFCFEDANASNFLKPPDGFPKPRGHEFQKIPSHAPDVQLLRYLVEL